MEIGCPKAESAANLKVQRLAHEPMTFQWISLIVDVIRTSLEGG